MPRACFLGRLEHSRQGMRRQRVKALTSLRASECLTIIASMAAYLYHQLIAEDIISDIKTNGLRHILAII